MKCEICKQIEHKYTCPACSMKTCSLKCCKQHKTDNNCTGTRDKTKYVKLENFNEHELLNDYRFLEEQQRIVDSTQRDLLKRRYDITSSMDYLRKLAYKQSSIIVRFMPRHSSKRLANKTRFDKTTKLISWHLEFKFHHHENNKQQQQQQQLFYFKDRLVSSKETIRNILNEFYNENEYKYFLNDQLLNEYKNEFEKFKQQQLQKQETSDNEELNVLFEVRNFKLKRKYYVKFDLNKTLEDNLRHKTIIEYPTIIIVLNKDLNNYNIEDESTLFNNNNNTNNSNNNTFSNQMDSNKQRQEQEQEKEQEKEEGECDDDDDDDNNVDGDKVNNSNQNSVNKNDISNLDHQVKKNANQDYDDDDDNINDVPDEIFNEDYYDDDDDDGDRGDRANHNSNEPINKKQKLCFNDDHFEFEFFSDKNLDLSKLTNNNPNINNSSNNNNNNDLDILIEKIE